MPRVLLAEHTDMSSSEVTKEADEHENKTSLSELWREVWTDNCEVAHLGVALHIHLCQGGGVTAQLQMSYTERHMGIPAHFCDSSLSTFRVSHTLGTCQLCNECRTYHCEGMFLGFRGRCHCSICCSFV